MSISSTPTLPTGQQYEIFFGDQQAIITEVGAALRSYRRGSRDLIVSFDADKMPTGCHGALLLPWPNRTEDGQYSFAGRDYQLPINEVELNNAHHGLVLHTRFTPILHEENRIELQLDLVPRPYYPFSLRVRISYELNAQGLEVKVETTNIGDQSAPYALGFHPWIATGGHRLAHCTLQLEAQSWYPANKRLLPGVATAIPPELDFSSPRLLGDLVLDDAFDAAYTSPAASNIDAKTWAFLGWPDGGKIGVWQGEGLGCWQLCTGDGLPGDEKRSGLAIESQSCVANALRTGNKLVSLAPGQSHQARWGITFAQE